MAIYVGSSSPGNDTDVKSDRIGLPNRSSNPSPASAGDCYFNTSDNEMRFFDGSEWVSLGAVAWNATGGSIATPGNGYTYHTFTSPGTWSGTQDISVEILLVGGGGGGGSAPGANSGGGGAGGLIFWNSMPLTANTNYAVIIGSGGSTNGDGGDSVFGPGTPVHLVSLGGGRGGAQNQAANPGGSGGGGSGFSQDQPNGAGVQTTDPGIPANSRTYGFGNAGGNAGGARADGGGGAGGAGDPSSAPNQYTSAGGVGRQYPNFTGPLIGVPSLNAYSGYYAGGGGGGYGGVGGSGGGGSGSVPGPSTPGIDNLGGGGGGNYNTGGTTTGGSGICVIRYQAPS